MLTILEVLDDCPMGCDTVVLATFQTGSVCEPGAFKVFDWSSRASGLTMPETSWDTATARQMKDRAKVQTTLGPVTTIRLEP